VNCPTCGAEPSWTVRIHTYFGNAQVLYHYGKLLGSQPRHTAPNIAGCDACRVAWGINEEAR
jgi:hypothetical protein